MSEDLRQMIRSLVLEELASHGAGAPSGAAPRSREEAVRIDSDQDLAQFVRRLMALSRDEQKRGDIEAGRHVFRLSRGAGSGPAPARAPGSGTGRAARLNGGLVTERQVRALAEDVTVVEVAKQARITPLAGDALRQAGIKIKRVTK